MNRFSSPSFAPAVVVWFIRVLTCACNPMVCPVESVQVRYARWAKVSHPLCCGDVDFTFTPCPPNSCPLSAAKSDLPAMPFEAEIVDGKCKCMAPQTCDYTPAA